MISRVRRTQLAFIAMRLLGTPCWCLLNMLVFILYKKFHVTPLQIAILIALKPASSLLSPYWSQAIYQRPDKLMSNLLGANFLRHLPFLWIPWINSPWYIIFAFGVYMTLTRATIPTWMEIFKHHLPDSKREKMVGYWSTIDFCGMALFSLALGFLLDSYPQMWKWLFSLTAALGIFSNAFLTGDFFQNISVPLPKMTKSFLAEGTKIKENLFKPWKRVAQLLFNHKDFAIFQMGFMLAGGGLMIMQPALPKIFVDNLHLSFTEMGLAIAFCKATGVALTNPLWTRLFRRINIFSFSALVTFFAAVFPFLLLATHWDLKFLYLAYLFYGVMQSGSEMSWHMSGLIFAREKDSSLFSMTNVLTVGIRGCIIPILGSLLLPYTQPLGIILLGALLCCLASCHFFFYTRRLSTPGKEFG
jgi:hypothetical protein